MGYSTNNDKMLEAVLTDSNLMKFGGYDHKDIVPLYQALSSDNLVVSAVAQIIQRSSEEDTSKEIYKEVTEYLKKNV